LAAPDVQVWPLHVPAFVVQVPVLPGMMLVPRQTQLLPKNCAQVVVPT